MTKEFNYEDAKNGAPVQTRDGRKARIICWDAKDTSHPIVALVLNTSGDEEFTVRYTNSGNHYSAGIDNLDLFMAIEKHEKWVNIYRKGDGTIFLGVCCNTEEDAKNHALGNNALSYVTTTKIEWEE